MKKIKQWMLKGICFCLLVLTVSWMRYDIKEVTGKSLGDTRDIVLVLDCSGSMDGEPLEQTRQAAQNFVDVIQKEKARVSVVTYSDYANVECSLTDDISELKSKIADIEAMDMTNIYSGLEAADGILEGSSAKKKIIVLMTDGLPNEGENINEDYQTPLVSYAQELKNKGYYMYTLGFFSNLAYDAPEELPGAQQMLERMASPGYHFEVTSADDLIFFFDDIAAQISGTDYVYVRIACPVNVTVKYGDEELSSDPDSENTRTSFGTLTYENAAENEGENAEEAENAYTYEENISQTVQSEDKVKILRLKMDKEYDIDIEGYDEGTMDYSVSYPNADGEYDDVREFPNIEVTADMKATSNTKEDDASILKIDQNGDGKYETTYKTKSNGEMKEVKDHTVLFLCLGVVIVSLLVVMIILIVVVQKNKKKKMTHISMSDAVIISRPENQTGYITGMFGKYQGRRYEIQTGMICTIGRSSSCNIQIIDNKVSRVHCTIELLPDGDYQVTERSSNGTFYNDVQLEKGKAYRIPKGALLAIGDADNVLLLE